MRLVDEAQKSKSRTQLLADRAAGWLFYVALGVAAITAVAWVVATGFNIGVLERVVTVLVIACPHARDRFRSWSRSTPRRLPRTGCSSATGLPWRKPGTSIR